MSHVAPRGPVGPVGSSELPSVQVVSTYLGDETQHRWTLPNGRIPWAPPVQYGYYRVSLNRGPDVPEGRSYLAVDRFGERPTVAVRRDSVYPFAHDSKRTPL